MSMSASGGAVRVPETHRSLLEGTVDVVLTTVGVDGYPHSSMVWCSYDGGNVLLNTGRGYAKERNMRRSPRVSVFACDQGRWVEVQGNVELVEEGAVEHLNQLCLRYTGKPDFYRDLMPELAGRETRVIVRVTPTRVRYGEAA